MADDADITKLPLEDRLCHKVGNFAPPSFNFNILEMTRNIQLMQTLYFFNLGVESKVKRLRRVDKTL